MNVLKPIKMPEKKDLIAMAEMSSVQAQMYAASGMWVHARYMVDLAMECWRKAHHED